MFKMEMAAGLGSNRHLLIGDHLERTANLLACGDAALPHGTKREHEADIDGLNEPNGGR